MSLMIVGLLIFFAAHSLPMERSLRNGLIERFGSVGYRAAFSIISLIGLVLIVLGYGKLQVLVGKNPQIWIPPIWLSHVTLLFMVFAMILLVAAYVPNNNIKRITRHPMLAAVKIWAFSHLLSNGDLASMVLFGSFLVYAILDRVNIKRRALTEPAVPAPKASLVNDLIVVVLGLALYAAFLFYLHKLLIGVSPLGMMAA